jgi:hypothetical protein
MEVIRIGLKELQDRYYKKFDALSSIMVSPNKTILFSGVKSGHNICFHLNQVILAFVIIIAINGIQDTKVIIP